MALLNIFDIAGSALAAQSKRLNVAASNLANADSVTGRTDSLIAPNRWFFRWTPRRVKPLAG
ncbi:flagellar basal-body rod protein FlgC [Salmonella enterica subsp. enterica]|uniref:Flagellar basal-body rod protein FlgC n=1 Tax=Salmonella enterica I TaxID=59201 RepID=A0A379WWX9_SALET|nr:flagellar basal-body rod protein FlgC [Salmonella enterica subsp. enterica]